MITSLGSALPPVPQSLHPAASQFLLGCDSPAAACLCAYQRLGTGVLQAGMSAALQAGSAAVAAAAASRGGAAPRGAAGRGSTAAQGAAAGATAAKQQLLAALERLPLLRAYAYSFAPPDDVMAVEAAAAAAAAAEDGAAAAAAAADCSLLAGGGVSGLWLSASESTGAAVASGTRASLEGALGWWPTSNGGAAAGEGIGLVSGAGAGGGGFGFGAPAAGATGGAPGTPSKRALVGAASSAGAANAAGEGRAVAAPAGAQLAPVLSCEPSLVHGRWSGAVDAWRPAARLVPLVMGQVG